MPIHSSIGQLVSPHTSCRSPSCSVLAQPSRTRTNFENVQPSDFNQTVPINGTTIIPLHDIDDIPKDALGQLKLNYVNPVGGHQLVLGKIFNIVTDPTQPKSITWNQNALATSTNPSSNQLSATASVPNGPSPFTPPSPSTDSSHLSSTFSTTSSSTSIVAHPTTSTTTKPSTGLQGGTIAAIVLGIFLSITFAIASGAVWRLYQHNKKRDMTEGPPTASSLDVLPSQTTYHPTPQELYAVTAPKELYPDNGRKELPGE
ncbi:MAG: hypothetical protein Q9179_006675 [Wetmoreana sp. 5 TL-2023]